MHNSILGRYLLAYRNKITNGLFSVVSVPAQGSKKVRCSCLYNRSVYAAPGNILPTHSNYWTSAEIARLFTIRGYDVDVINWNDNHFMPRKKYAACVDLQYNLRKAVSISRTKMH